MRFFEIQAQNSLVLILRNIIGRSSSKKQAARYNWASINSILKKSGHEEIDYDAFKAVYDSDPVLQNIVHDFNADGISLKVSGSKDSKMNDKNTTDKQSSQDQVDQIAAGAAEKNLSI